MIPSSARAAGDSPWTAELPAKVFPHIPQGFSPYSGRFLRFFVCFFQRFLRFFVCFFQRFSWFFVCFFQRFSWFLILLIHLIL